ncbi:MAG: hypothetical protein ABR554_17490 [Pyrinomonadaceae bacterium]
MANGAHKYEQLRRVYVVTEFKYSMRLRYYDFPRDSNAHLRLWLLDAKGNPGEFDDPTTMPQVIVSGNFMDGGAGGAPTVLVESSQKLVLKDKPHKKDRGYRFEHKHNNKEFRIGKWQLTSPDGNTVHFGEFYKDHEADKFTFMLLFYGM